MLVSYKVCFQWPQYEYSLTSARMRLEFGLKILPVCIEANKIPMSAAQTSLLAGSQPCLKRGIQNLKENLKSHADSQGI